MPGTAGDVERAEVERRAAERGLLAVRWPEPFPFDSRTAMLAATFAKQAGRAVAFSLAAMRQAFAAGRDLGEVDNVLVAAAACELHPRAVLKGVEGRGAAQALREATERAVALGVGQLPAVAYGSNEVVVGKEVVDLVLSDEWFLKGATGPSRNQPS
jgi:2-hydroxychromene-2-carboxylate isomerase